MDKKPPLRAAQVREARLKAALKANMGRRKEQAKLRDAAPGVSSGPGPDSDTSRE
jgi:hypothetical protein